MKKIYLLLLSVFIALLCFGQVPKENINSESTDLTGKSYKTNPANLLFERNSILKSGGLITPFKTASGGASDVIISNNVFLQGQFIEVGVSECGCFGTTEGQPAGYHGNMGALGFVADPDQDGWTTGTPAFHGDFFLPGSPEEGFGVQIDGTNYGNFETCGTYQIPVSSVSNDFYDDTHFAFWNGSINGLDINQEVSFKEDGLFFIIKVDLTNTNSSDLNNVYYMRNVDPDNEQPWTSDFVTTNTVISQPSSENGNQALVQATGLSYGMYLGLAAVDSRAKVSYGGFSNRDASNIWNASSGFYHSGTETNDIAISVSFNLGTFLPGETKTIYYAYILDATLIDKMFENIVEVLGSCQEINADNDLGECGAIVDFDIPVIDGADVSQTDETGLSSGSFFPLGTTMLKYRIDFGEEIISDTCISIIVHDVEPPVASCQNITIQLDENGNATTTATDVDFGSEDICGEITLSLDLTDFTCENIGENTVVLTVTDDKENSSMCSAIVTVEDNVGPAVVCTPLEIVLYDNGEYVLTAQDIKAMAAGTTDNCSATEDIVLDVFPKSFECVHVGEPVDVRVFAVDSKGNKASCWTTVTVYDETPPVAICENVTVSLDANGQAKIFSGQINAGNSHTSIPSWARTYNGLESGSYDACGVDYVSLDKYYFSCSDTGIDTVTMTVADRSGNKSICLATVTVNDMIVPVINDVSDIEVVVEPGVCETEIEYPGIVVSDNCDVTIEHTTGLGADGMFPLGTTTETWVATDNGGNTAEITFDVTVTTTNAEPTLDSIADIDVDEDTEMITVQLSEISYGVDCKDQAFDVTAEATNTDSC